MSESDDGDAGDSLQQRLEQLEAWVRSANERSERNEKMLAEFGRILETLTKILAARGSLEPGHVSVLEKLAKHAVLVREPQLQLSAYDDKYTLENSEVDCGARMHLCHGRCCSFNVKLSEQDLTEGKVAWRIHQPYLIAQTPQGYCVYQAQDTGFCGNYHYRPGACRTYDCKEDRRIWLDFENMIPAPMPDGLVTIRRTPPKPGA